MKDKIFIPAVITTLVLLIIFLLISLTSMVSKIKELSDKVGILSLLIKEQGGDINGLKAEAKEIFKLKDENIKRQKESLQLDTKIFELHVKFDELVDFLKKKNLAMPEMKR